MKHLKLIVMIMTVGVLLCGCSKDTTSKQTRSDLTEEHFHGLSSDMKSSDVEDLVGKSDSALGENERLEMYSLTDGTTAVLRYAGDKLQSAYIRGKDMIERPIFDNYREGGSNTINDGTTGTDNPTSNESTSMESNESGSILPNSESDQNGANSTLDNESSNESENTGNMVE